MATIYEEVYNVSEVAKIFKVRTSTVRRLIRNGQLPAIRVGRHFRVPKSVIDRMFAEPVLTNFDPEEMGFRMWAEDPEIGDSVEYVNNLRASSSKSLLETIQELDQWEREHTSL